MIIIRGESFRAQGRQSLIEEVALGQLA